MPSKNEIMAEILEMGQEFNAPVRVNLRNSKTNLQAEHDRLSAISEGVNRPGINEFKVELEEKDDRKVRVVVKKIRKWRKDGMVGGLELDRNKIGNAVLVKALRIAVGDIKVVAKFGNGKTYTINQSFLDHLLRLSLNIEEITTSDEIFLAVNIDDGEDILTLLKVKEEVGVKERPGGAFFKYLSHSKYNLTRQQIFNRITPAVATLVDDNCLLYALITAGLDEKNINSIKMKIKTRTIPAKDIRIITDSLNIFITVKNLQSKKTNRYGNPESEFKFTLGLVEEHYFLIEETTITKYAFRHNLNEDDWNIVDGSGTRTRDKFIDTFDAVRLLLKPNSGLIEDIPVSSELFQSTYSSGIKKFKDLTYDPKDIRNISSKAMKAVGVDISPESIEDEILSKVDNYDKSNVVFFDFETNISGRHKPFLCHYLDKDRPEEQNGFEGYDCGEKMLRNLCRSFGTDGKKPAIVNLYAHNAGYDYRFLIRYLKIERILRQGSGLLSCVGKFHHKGLTIEVIIKDTYKLISKPLRDFGDMFSLDTEKEVMPYSLQTNQYIDDGGIIPMVDVLNCKEMKDPEFKKAFLENCEKWECIYDDEFELFKYASLYCRIDCEVLHKGFEIFNGWMLETTGESIFNHLTIPSLVHEYFINQGCYTDVYELSGVCRAYIQKCVVGGRTALANNSKIIKTEPIADFDAVSLYPSAMSRMNGFLRGVPKVLTVKTDEFLKSTSGYFIRIFISRVGIKRAFPLMSEMRNGVRCFVNESMVMFIDKTGLEDLVKFQEIKYDILDGYYFSEGFNDTIKGVINHLFQARIEKKKEGNPVQEVLKLVMNSSYGKSLLKPITHKDKIFNTEKALNKYVIRNFSVVESYTRIHETAEKYVLKEVIPISTHFNIPQIGVEILSTSKRIMNEVICLAEDENIDIYYQDTDSLHLKQDGLDDLIRHYWNKFNKNLSGDAMGQFNSDFKMKNCSGVHSKHFIGLGKKSYLDVISGTDKKGNLKEELHIRMKGIPTSCVRFTADKLYGGNVVALYEAMFEGLPIEFDLLQGGSKCSFQQYQDLSILNRDYFTRELKF